MLLSHVSRSTGPVVTITPRFWRLWATKFGGTRGVKFSITLLEASSSVTDFLVLKKSYTSLPAQFNYDEGEACSIVSKHVVTPP